MLIPNDYLGHQGFSILTFCDVHFHQPSGTRYICLNTYVKKYGIPSII